MAHLEFADVGEAEALLRGIVAFKFECGEEADLYAGSPPFAAAARRLLSCIVRAHEERGDAARAESWRRTYDLEDNDHVKGFVARHAARHPRWDGMPAAERREWLDVVASPYHVGDATAAWLVSAVDEQRRR